MRLIASEWIASELIANDRASFYASFGTHGKYPSTSDLLTRRSIKFKYHLQALPNMFSHVCFKTPTVDNLLQPKNPFITFVIICNWRFWHWVLQIFKIWCSFPFFHSLQQSSKTYTLTVYRSICSIVISFKNLQTCWNRKYQNQENLQGL